MNNRGTSATVNQATNLLGVILATGGTAVVLLLKTAHADGDYLLPASIAVVTIALAIIGYRFGKKYADEIGEARFETTSNEQRDLPAAQCRED